MITPQSIYQFSETLNALYVEDDTLLREEMTTFLEVFFKSVETAENGQEGLDKYNHNTYDVVFTDLNMPIMGGAEMIQKIHEINPDQKIIAISAYNDADTLLELIRSGTSSFILKPILEKDALKVLYPVCRDARTQQMNNELFSVMNQQKHELEMHVRRLEAQLNTVAVKHQQMEHMLSVCPISEPDPILKEYFMCDTDEGDENVLFHKHDSDEIIETMSDIIESINAFAEKSNLQYIIRMGELFQSVGAILFHYTPFLDPLAKSMEELGLKITTSSDAFTQMMSQNQTMALTLFDAIKIDMERYVKRFSEESMAMKNIHHIHEPTSMSIRQVIALIEPDEIEGGEIEFF